MRQSLREKQQRDYVFVIDLKSKVNSVNRWSERIDRDGFEPQRGVRHSLDTVSSRPHNYMHIISLILSYTAFK